jgi:hypothetical protein
MTCIRSNNLIPSETVWGHLRTENQDSHITQPPISQPPRHYLVTPVTFLVLVCAQNLHGHHSLCLQKTFTHVIKKFCSPSSFADLESCHPWPNLRAAAIRQQDTSSQGKAGTPFSDQMLNPGPSPKLLELLIPQYQKQTHRRQKIKRVQTCAHSSWANMQAQNGWQWLLLISLRQSYLPLTWDLSRSKNHNPSRLAERLGGCIRACCLGGNGVVQESRRRSKDPLNMQVT